jgi:hypothetical protein
LTDRRRLILLALVAVVGVAALTVRARDMSTDIDGLPILTVSEAIAMRASGQAEGRILAIQGFYSSADAHRCQPPRTPISELEGWLRCRSQDSALAERDEPVGATPTGGLLPAGPHLRPHFPGYTHADLNAPPGQTTEVVFLGHFDDRRARLCSAERLVECREVFFVDRVARAAGRSLGPSVWQERSGLEVDLELSSGDVEALVRQQLGPQAHAHWLAALRAKDIAAFDPTTPVDPTGLGTLWYVQAATADPMPGAIPDRLVTLIFIDSTRELRWSSDAGEPFAQGALQPEPGTQLTRNGAALHHLFAWRMLTVIDRRIAPTYSGHEW